MKKVKEVARKEAHKAVRTHDVQLHKGQKPTKFGKKGK